MKLTKLYIHNYKSFYDTTIELDKLNIVVGENNSGKSNLIDVLEFIDIFLKEDYHNQAIIKKGSFDKILNYNNDVNTIFIEFELDNKTFFKKTRITLKRDLILYSTIIYNSKKEIYQISSYRTNLAIDKHTNKYYLNEKKSHDLRSFDFMQLIPVSNISMSYAFNTETIKNKSHRQGEKELKKDGSNLGQNLLYIKNNYPDSFNLISNSMIGVVNEIKGIEVQETFGNALIGFKERNKEIGIDMVSDGTINLLATITALNQGKDKSIILAFDEPERYLHIKAVHYLMDSFRSSKKQIVITTHSTEILKYADLSEVIFIYRDSDGYTQSIRADTIPNIQEKMEYMSYKRPMSLDELISEDLIGDFE
jgi:predicted ATPase